MDIRVDFIMLTLSKQLKRGRARVCTHITRVFKENKKGSEKKIRFNEIKHRTCVRENHYHIYLFISNVKLRYSIYHTVKGMLEYKCE